MMALKRQPDQENQTGGGCSETAVDVSAHNRHQHPDQPNARTPGDGISDRERDEGHWGSSAADGSIPSEAELEQGDRVPRVSGPERTMPAPGRSRPDR